MSGPQVISVSQFIDLARDYLSGFGEVVVQGEVTEVRRIQDRHLLYFSLKDEKSRILCFAIERDAEFDVHDGEEIRVFGTPSLFKASGQFHFKVHQIEFVGEGAIRRALERLKKKLENEGLFEISHKRMLPKFPQTIGLITSRDAAAYSDVLKEIKRREWPLKIRFYNAQVQGIRAVSSLIRALLSANTSTDVEAIIITRGGGSMEELQAFNNEEIARAIYNSRVPVVCGVGHERDWTVADLVADVRAAAPSIAAAVLVPNRREVINEIESRQKMIIDSFVNQINNRTRAIVDLFKRLDRGLSARVAGFTALVGRFFVATGRITERMRQQRERINVSAQCLVRALQLRLTTTREGLTGLERLVFNLSPKTLLTKGYSIVSKDGHVVKSTGQIATGDSVRVELADGRFSSTVNDTTHD